MRHLRRRHSLYGNSTFESWYMMNGGDLYELATILGHSNIKVTERYAKLGREHITKTSTTAKVIWSLMKKKPEQEEGDQQDVPRCKAARSQLVKAGNTKILFVLEKGWAISF